MTREQRDIFAPWRFTYGAESRRRLAASVVAVPRALGALDGAARRPGRLRGLGRALLALPVAVASTALTAVLAYLVLINVLAYPIRPWLGLGEQIGTAWYAHAWGGPTLAGAWATHAALVLLLVVPPMVWAVRGLTALQWRLTDHHRVVHVTARPLPPRRLTNRTSAAPAVAPSPAVRVAPAVVEPVAVRPAPPLPVAVVTRPVRQDAGATRGGRGRRVGAVLAAVGLLVACSLTAHANGIGDNLIWAPRDLTSGVALAVTLTPVAGLLLLRRTAWWRSPARLR
ncbi:hypothetical protein RMN56_10495 [Micromonospora halotolerans]|uniref:Sensor domain-containing protein n=1 Tax=Micromonospora halotolerans TaxID=709879 RepID=A0ABZ0A2R2_9ACTN|nr:hypothetical protein [Micromonospora halotolerans]WNM41733.1 hypothetical protein RMN56_10495 [Micromonospora halotolerans]